MAEIDDLRHETNELRLQIEALKAELGIARELLAEQDRQGERLAERVAQLYRLSVPAAAGTRIVLGEMASVISASGQSADRYQRLIDALVKAISEIRESARQ